MMTLTCRCGTVWQFMAVSVRRPADLEYAVIDGWVDSHGDHLAGHGFLTPQEAGRRQRKALRRALR